MPKPMLLSAPFTPFTYQNNVNLSAVPALADHAAKFGVNTVWTVGGMGQFETLTMNGKRSSRCVVVCASERHAGCTDLISCRAQEPDGAVDH